MDQRHPSRRSALRIAQQIRATGIFIGIAVLLLTPLDLLFGIFDRLYADAAIPRTHPLTWLSLALMLVAILLQRPMRIARPLERGIWMVIILIAIARPMLSDAISALAPPDLYLGSMGTNTALACILAALGQLLYGRLSRWGVVAAIGALFMPAVALNGVLLGRQEYFGHMALPTALGLFSFGLANLMRFARRPAMRLLLIDTQAGRLVRMQLLGWIALALVTPFALRFVEYSHSQGIALLYTAHMTIVLAAVIFFGLRYVALLDSARRVERALLREAETDLLTGLATRRAAIAYFANRAWRDSLALILLDIDHFKRINDRHGHAAGDRVLAAVGMLLQKELRVTDMAARWGGEEFLIIVRTRNGAGVEDLGERLRRSIEAGTCFETGVPRVTASLGITVTTPGSHRDLTTCLEQADAALYEAKREGRNRVVMAGGTDDQRRLAS